MLQNAIKETRHILKVPKSYSPLNEARAKLIRDEYFKKGIFTHGEHNYETKIFEIIKEYNENPFSKSYLLFDLNQDTGIVRGKATATYTIDKLQNSPSIVEGLWREEDIKIILKEANLRLEDKVAEISRFATNTEKGKKSAQDIMRIYGKMFSEIKEHTDHVLVSSCVEKSGRIM